VRDLKRTAKFPVQRTASRELGCANATKGLRNFRNYNTILPKGSRGTKGALADKLENTNGWREELTSEKSGKTWKKNEKVIQPARTLKENLREKRKLLVSIPRGAESVS